MNRLLSLAVTCLATLTGGVSAQQPPQAPPDTQQTSPKQVADWVQDMRIDALKEIAKGDQAKAAGKDDVALDRYMSAHQIYKTALLPEELQRLATEITTLRAKLGMPPLGAPTTAPKTIDLSDPAIASKRTDALRLMSEADQYLDEGKYQQAGELFTRVYFRFRDALPQEEEDHARQGLMTARERLGLPPLPPGDDGVMPYVVRSGDDEIDSLCMLISGTFASRGSEGQPAISFNSAPVKLDGATNGVYFEVARTDDPAHPFRQGVLTFIRLDTQLRLRILDIPNPALREAVVGMWAASDVFPSASVDSLSVNVDLVMTRNTDGSGYTAMTPGRVPTVKGGAVLMTSHLKLNSDGLTIDDRGFDANGAEVWRSGAEAGVQMLRTAAPKVVTRRDDGLVTIDLVPGDAANRLQQGGEIALHFTQWVPAAGTRVDTSRVQDRAPIRVRYPLGSIKGLDDGLAEIPMGCTRRIVIPAELGWGAQGRGTQIPPNSVLVFEIEAVWIGPPPEPIAPIPAADDQAGPPAPAAPAPRTGGGH